MRTLMVILLVCVACLYCFNSGFDLAEMQNLTEKNELLESNIRLQILVNVYEQNYGTLNEKDAELFFREKEKTRSENSSGRIGLI